MTLDLVVAHPPVARLLNDIRARLGSAASPQQNPQRTDVQADHRGPRVREGVAVDPEGRVARSGTLGDGIEHVRTTLSGKIWVGYFDEGIYGGGDGAESLGAPGLVHYTGRLQPEWRFPVRDDLDPIEDCYALNVVGEAAWATYYCNFPVVRIADGLVGSSRPGPRRGPRSRPFQAVPADLAGRVTPARSRSDHRPGT